MSKIREVLKNEQRLITEVPLYKKDGTLSYQVFIARCPSLNCPNTVRIEKIKQIGTRCKRCAFRGRKRGKPKDYHTVTEDIRKTRLLISQKYKKYFLREEASTDLKHYVGVFRCPSDGCTREIRLRRREKLRECNSCCRKGKPFERTYNNAKLRTDKRTKNIQWLLSYDDFVALCRIENCHYCNKFLNRAEYKSSGGSVSILLDRKDSSGHYTLENCVPCCAECNFTKHEKISYDEMVLIMKHRGCWIDKP